MAKTKKDYQNDYLRFTKKYNVRKAKNWEKLTVKELRKLINEMEVIGSGNKPTFESGEEILNYFMCYVESEGKESRFDRSAYDKEDYGFSNNYRTSYVPISVNGFLRWLRRKQNISIGTTQFYDHYYKKYPNCKEEISFLIEEHFVKGIAIGDINPTFGNFYLKNRFGFKDVQEQKVEATVTENKLENIEAKLESLTIEQLAELSNE